MNFAPRRMDHDSRDTQNRRLARLSREVQLLDANRAAQLAYGILDGILDHGVSYADFQSAQAAELNIRKARNALSGSLS